MTGVLGEATLAWLSHAIAASTQPRQNTEVHISIRPSSLSFLHSGLPAAATASGFWPIMVGSSFQGNELPTTEPYIVHIETM